MKFKDVYFTEAQEIDSAKTSRPQVAALHNLLLKNGVYTINDLVLDWGGGKYDRAKDVVEASADGIRFLVYDPYNRSKEHNKEVLVDVKEAGGATIITLANVLNVIRKPEDRLKTLKSAKKYLAKGGKVYISVYQAPKSDKYEETDEYVGQMTSDGWQNAQPLSFYLPEVKKVFPSAVKKGSMIVAE